MSIFQLSWLRLQPAVEYWNFQKGFSPKKLTAETDLLLNTYILLQCDKVPQIRLLPQIIFVGINVPLKLG